MPPDKVEHNDAAVQKPIPAENSMHAEVYFSNQDSKDKPSLNTDSKKSPTDIAAKENSFNFNVLDPKQLYPSEKGFTPGSNPGGLATDRFQPPKEGEPAPKTRSISGAKDLQDPAGPKDGTAPRTIIENGTPKDVVAPRNPDDSAAPRDGNAPKRPADASVPRDLAPQQGPGDSTRPKEPTDTAAKPATPEQQMLDPNVSPEQKIAIADQMYKSGQKSFKGPDGQKYEITEAKAGDRRMVGVFTTDEHGHSKTALRGIVEKDGHVSKQTDSKGRPVDYESQWAKSHDGGGLRKPEAVTRGVDEKDGSKYERKSDGRGGYVEQHTGDKPEQNYSKTNDGKGKISVMRKDGSGYSRTEEPSGQFTENHFGPKPEDTYTVKGDGKGNNVESRNDGQGNSIEKHTFADPSKNYTQENHADKSTTVTDAKGNKTVTSGDGNTTTYTGADGTGYVRTKENNGYSETHTGPKPEDNYNKVHRDDGQGNVFDKQDFKDGRSVESHQFKNPENNFTKETKPGEATIVTDSKGSTTTSPDGKTITFVGKDGTGYTRTMTDGGYTEQHTGPKPEDKYTLEHKDDGKGGAHEKYSFEDPKKNFTKDVNPDGTYTVTDSVGLKIDVKGGSPEFQKQMLADIQSLPEADRKRLADKDIHYGIGSKMSEIDPSLKGVHPRGWPEGKTWDDAEGGYNEGKKLILLSENTNAGPSKRLGGVLRHETGHAVDDTLGDFSHTDEFKKAYEADVARMTPEQQREFKYLLQHDKDSSEKELPTTKAGQEETAAEVYGMLQGSSSNPSQTEQIKQMFPSVAEALKKRLAQSK